MRRLVVLTRDVKTRGPLGTFGCLWTGSFACVTLERPFSGEHPCIPPGEYDVDWTSDGRNPIHNPCYEIMNVTGRTNILIHPANVFEQIEGCIAPGTRIQNMEIVWEGQHLNHKGISGSRTALGNLLVDLNLENFRLVIKE